jgi:hypothetical protein
MDVGDCLARIAESQIGTRGDLHSGRAALYGYLLATNAKLGAFEPKWTKTGFGSDRASRYGLLSPGESDSSSHFGLLDAHKAPELPAILRIHSWCAAFVDWCVMELLTKSPSATSLQLALRPRTASAFGLLTWGKTTPGCLVVHGYHTSPVRGDIVVFNFSHTGIVVESGKGHFHSVEGNTTPGTGGNQGYIVQRRMRVEHLMKGFIRLPPKYRLGDYNISSGVSHMA